MSLILSRIPWLRLAPYALLTVLAGLLWLQTGRLNDANIALSSERKSRNEVARIVGAENNWISIRSHAGNLVEQNGKRGAVLDRISSDTLAAKKRADQLDTQLRRQQEEHDRRFAIAQRTIADLQRRRPTGDADADLQTIREDSKAPWEGWHPYVGQISLSDPDHAWAGKEYLHTTVIINLIRYKSLREVNQKWWALGKKGWVFGFAYSEKDNNVCDIHVIDPEQDYAPVTLGHELAHCIYGGWHA